MEGSSKRRFALATAAGLAACSGGGFQPTPVDFATSPEVFRGAWVGATRDATTGATAALRLEVTATYRTRQAHGFAGTFRLGDGPTYRVEGEQRGNDIVEFVQPQSQPNPKSVDASVLDERGVAVYHLGLGGEGCRQGRCSYNGALGDAGPLLPPAHPDRARAQSLTAGASKGAASGC